MLALAQTVLDWLADGHRVAVATIVDVRGRSPRPAGTSMLVRDDGAVDGSVSGGCIEGELFLACQETLRTTLPQLFTGQTCAGTVRCVLSLLTPQDLQTPVAGQLRAAADGTAARLAVGTDGPGLGRWTSTGFPAGEAFWLDQPDAPRMILIGATDEAVALSSLGHAAGYRVSVCDPRPVFARPDRFPAAEVVRAWPATWFAHQELDERTVVALLAHDERYDVDVLAEALRREPAFVGALASRPTATRRAQRLRATGVDPRRLRSPIGLDLGARTPVEVAVAILAQILAERHGTDAVPLQHREGAIHLHPSAIARQITQRPGLDAAG